MFWSLQANPTILRFLMSTLPLPILQAAFPRALRHRSIVFISAGLPLSLSLASHRQPENHSGWFRTVGIMGQSKSHLDLIIDDWLRNNSYSSLNAYFISLMESLPESLSEPTWWTWYLLMKFNSSWLIMRDRHRYFQCQFQEPAKYEISSQSHRKKRFGAWKVAKVLNVP